ncbi:unnamed protein product [Camellia sinensis]
MEEVKGSDAEAEKDGGALKFDANSNSADLILVSLQGQMLHLAWMLLSSAKAHIWNCRGRRCTVM